MKKDVYVLLDPLVSGQYCYGKRLPISFLFKPIYVGIGQSAGRYKMHLYQAQTNKGNNFYKNRTIKRILDSDRKPLLMVLYEQIEPDTAGFIEEYLIETFRRKPEGGTLTNLTRGGEGILDPTLEVREKIRLAALNQSAEKRNSISKAQSGKTVSDETREKLRKHNLGKKQSEETIRKRMESIDQIRSDELHWKMGSAMRGKKRSKEHTEKLRASNTGKTRSEKSKERMRISAIKAWERRKQQERQSAAKLLND